MKLRAQTRRPHHETIIALIDVVFFLLVFFMLIGRMEATAPFDVVPPIAQTGSDLPAGGLAISVDNDGALALGDTLVEHDALLAHVAEAITHQPDKLIRVTANGSTRLQQVLPLVAEIEALGAKEVALVVTPDPT
ncbi:ExbD/TolR family protein [Qingshengfaniella alkalisoli]|uniref:Biopolymer transporter ExbD n=1 Tax=Qingshengfaniella alkalisoli TaxID=2599296 RepID=A0A5B8IYP4_9RHOB|nr:biopolymer transporter ExbD [Qingshengfaniella alkalisoli]QDY71242.1 biopolymer transporter ExbD [Qingshengfaniella alkalisoli]